jgi:O-antigen/teichoic acid export membrane protein
VGFCWKSYALLKRNTVANFLGYGWSALIALAFIPVYIRFLGIEAYGLIGLFSVLLMSLGLLDLGMSPMISREMARFSAGVRTAASIRDLLRSAEWIAFGVAAIVILVLVLVSGWLASHWVKPGSLPASTVVHAFEWMAFVIGLRFVENIYRSALQGLQRQVETNLVMAAAATFRALGVVAVLSFVNPTVEAYFIWQGLVSVLSLLTFALLAYRALPASERGGRFSIAELKPVVRFSGGLMGIALSGTLLTQLDKLLLSRILSLPDFGVFMLASSLAGGLLSLCIPIAQAWYPRLSALHAERNEAGLVSTFHLGAQLVSVLVGSAALFLIAFADPILALWTQDEALATKTANLVQLLAFANLLNALMYIPYQAQLAHGWTSLTLRIAMAAVLVICPAILYVAPRYGAEGAAMIWVAFNIGYMMIGMHLMFKRILTTEKWEWYGADILMPLLPAALVAALLSYVMPVSPPGMAQAGLLAASGLLIFTAALLGAGRVRSQAIALLRAGRGAA